MVLPCNGFLMLSPAATATSAKAVIHCCNVPEYREHADVKDKLLPKRTNGYFSFAVLISLQLKYLTVMYPSSTTDVDFLILFFLFSFLRLQNIHADKLHELNPILAKQYIQ